MKNLRKIIGTALALTMAMSLTLPALAATYDVETSAQVIEAVEKHNSSADGDRTVILNMKNDITMEAPIETVKDRAYTFQGNGHSLKNVTVVGAGTTNIQADICNDGYSSGLNVKDNAVVTVTGDISTDECEFSALKTSGHSNVTVTGNISTETKDVSKTSWGVMATNDSTVTVTGDVTAVGKDSNGLVAYQNSTVTVTGDVTAAGAGSSGISAADNSAVTVTGNVKGDQVGAIAIQDSSLTIRGDVTGNGQGVIVSSMMDGHTSLTINGDIQSDGSALTAFAADQSSSTVEITGNLSSREQNTLQSVSDSSINVTVTGNTEVSGSEGSTAWNVQILDQNSQVKLTQKGNITSETGDALRLTNDSETGKITLELEGTVSSGIPESKGIQVSGRSRDASVNISLDGKLNGVVYRIDHPAQRMPVNIVYREPEQGIVSMPGKLLPAVFTAEDLDGRAVSSEENMVLIYFDPADPESLEALRKGQETASQGETVFAVCLTEDYAGARALMEKAGAEYPVLKCNHSLREILTAHGGTDPLTIVVREGKFQAPARETIGTVYVEKELEIVPKMMD